MAEPTQWESIKAWWYDHITKPLVGLMPRWFIEEAFFRMYTEAIQEDVRDWERDTIAKVYVIWRKGQPK